MDRNAMIRVPLAWSNVSHLARILNPQEETDVENIENRQTVELRTPDGSALVHPLLAGIVIAAEWSFKDENSLKLAEKHYVKSGLSNDNATLKSFPKLPGSCDESSRILLEKRALYEREALFPPSAIDYVVQLLQDEKDKGLSKKLKSLSGKQRLGEIQKIMHKDLHRH